MSQRENPRIGFLLIVTALILMAFGRSETALADSIWNRAGGKTSTLYSTTKAANKIGDIITILIVEETSATNDTNMSTDKESQFSLSLDGFDEILGLTHVFGKPISANPNFDVDAQSQFDGDGSSDRSFAITGTVSGQITEVLPNGNLRIEASQAVKINEEKNSVILVGTVRPQDISAQNTILSTQIANSEIYYAGKGPLSTVGKRGVIKEFLEFVWPF
jgi:flagellar L-ring protein precursor FlgH